MLCYHTLRLPVSYSIFSNLFKMLEASSECSVCILSLSVLWCLCETEITCWQYQISFKTCNQPNVPCCLFSCLSLCKSTVISMRLNAGHPKGSTTFRYLHWITKPWMQISLPFTSLFPFLFLASHTQVAWLSWGAALVVCSVLYPWLCCSLEFRSGNRKQDPIVLLPWGKFCHKAQLLFPDGLI